MSSVGGAFTAWYVTHKEIPSSNLDVTRKAYLAGAEWQRERDAEWCETHAIATDTRGGYVVIEPVKGALFDGQRYAREIRKGDA